MKIWIIDTETTGLPYQPSYGKYYHYSKLNFYEESRVVQIGILEYEFLNGEYKKTNTYEFIHKGDFKIKNEEFHGITNEIMINNGISMKKIIDLLGDNFNDVSLMIAHNMKFDRTLIASEMHRVGLKKQLKDFLLIPTFCTSEGTRDIVKLKKNSKYKGGYKQPKLIELYKWLFNKQPLEIENMHNALVDCKVLSECFFELVRKGYYKIKKRK